MGARSLHIEIFRQRCAKQERTKERGNARSGKSVGDPACIRAEPKEALQDRVQVIPAGCLIRQPASFGPD